MRAYQTTTCFKAPDHSSPRPQSLEDIPLLGMGKWSRLDINIGVLALTFQPGKAEAFQERLRL